MLHKFVARPCLNIFARYSTKRDSSSSIERTIESRSDPQFFLSRKFLTPSRFRFFKNASLLVETMETRKGENLGNERRASLQDRNHRRQVDQDSSVRKHPYKGGSPLGWKERASIARYPDGTHPTRSYDYRDVCTSVAGIYTRGSGCRQRTQADKHRDGHERG